METIMKNRLLANSIYCNIVTEAHMVTKPCGAKCQAIYLEKLRNYVKIMYLMSREQ